MNNSTICTYCGGPSRLAGFVSLPAQSIFHCSECNISEWKDGLPHRFKAKVEQRLDTQRARL